MAILTTARAVLRDEATRQQAHLIREHLDRLGEDFGRFRRRLEELARHVELANRDAQAVNASAQRITRRFQRIDDAELTQLAGTDEGADVKAGPPVAAAGSQPSSDQKR